MKEKIKQLIKELRCKAIEIDKELSVTNDSLSINEMLDICEKRGASIAYLESVTLLQNCLLQ